MTGEKKAMTAKGYGIAFWGVENVLKLIVVMVAELCKYTKKNPFNCTLNFFYEFILFLAALGLC